MSFFKNLKKFFKPQKYLLIIGEKAEYVAVARKVFKYFIVEIAKDFVDAQKMLVKLKPKYAIINLWLNKKNVSSQIKKLFEQYLDDSRMNLFLSQREKELIKEEDIWPLGVFLVPICLKRKIKFAIINDRQNQWGKVGKVLSKIFLEDLGVKRLDVVEIDEIFKSKEFFWGTVGNYYFR